MRRTVLRADTVIAGDDLVPLENCFVVVEDGVIVSVGPDCDELAVDVELGELTVVPGFIDTHVHLSSDASPHLDLNSSLDLATLLLRRDSSDDLTTLLLQIVSNVQRFLRVGVTTVRDLGGPFTLGSEVRDAINRGEIFGPRLLVANRPITVTGGHGHRIGIECDDTVALRRAVRQLVKDGSDWVKVMASGGFANFRRSEGKAPYFPLFTLNEMRTIVDEAHRYDLPVAAHCQNREAIAVAFEAGVDTIEHCTFAASPHAVLDEDLVRAIAERGTPVVPTVNNYWLTIGVPWAPRDIALANLRRLHELGVRLVAGTDMGLPTTTPEMYAEGLKVFDAIGMDPRQTLASATTLAADAIGLAEVTGSIRPGLAADLVALAGNPLTDVDAYSRPRVVVARGQVLSFGASVRTPTGSDRARR